jgi:predicted dehydrogenase
MKPVDNEDLAHALVRFGSGAAGVLAASRVAHGRKNGLRIEVHGSKGMIVFDQERLNELQLLIADGEPATRGFRTLLTGPLHPPYGTLCPAPGHGLGFNDLKVIEVAEFLSAIATGAANAFAFAEGLAVERVIHGFIRSANERRWIDVG